MLSVQGLQLHNLRGDLFGGMTAAVVALPLALAFGVSSGAGAIAGVYGAIFVGFFAALFGGTPSQVSGPTGPMTVVMAAIFTQFVALDPVAGPAIAFTVVVMGGLFQILFGVFKLGQYITLVPFPVISGFMTGIGVIIISLQLAPLFGHPAHSTVIDSLVALPEVLSSLNLHVVVLSVITLIIVLKTPVAITRWVPAALIALLVGTLVSYGLFAEEGIPVIGDIPAGLPAFVAPQFDLSLLKDMVLSALMLAALGSIDSLLTSLVADNISRTHHDSDRELIGQGIGNMLAGMFGGLPGAGATMRTVVNIRAGGQTPISGMVHALILLIIVLGAGPLAEHIPHAVLAGILIKVGLDIIDWNFLRRVHRAPLFVVVLMTIVLLLTVFVDLITAVAVGVFIANVITVKRLADNQLESMQVIADSVVEHRNLLPRESDILREAGGRILLYQFSGPVSYGSAKGIVRKLAKCREHDALLLDFTNVPFIDVSTSMAIEDMILDARRFRRDVSLIGANPVVTMVLQKMQIMKLIADDHRFESRIDALEAAMQRLS